MKKKHVGILVIALVAFLIFGGQVNAQTITTDYGYIIPYFGINYNTLDIQTEEFTMELSDKFYDDGYDEFGDYYDIDKSASSAYGFYFGGLHWFDLEKYENWAVGGEFERINTVEMEDDDVRIRISNLGFLVTGAYRLKDVAEDFSGQIDLIFGAGLYKAKFNMRDKVGDFEVENSYWGPGAKLGIQGAYLLEEDISIGGRLGYRYSQPHSEGDLDYNGFEIGLQLGFGF